MTTKPKWDATPKTHIPSTIRPARTRTPGTTPGWLIALYSVTPGLAFVGGIIAGRWGM